MGGGGWGWVSGEHERGVEINRVELTTPPTTLTPPTTATFLTTTTLTTHTHSLSLSLSLTNLRGGKGVNEVTCAAGVSGKYLAIYLPKKRTSLMLCGVKWSS